MASQSVWGTFESQLLMRRLTIVGVNLLFLWSLSPLGGQASLRLLDKSMNTIESFKQLRYLSTGPGSAAWAMSSGTYVEMDESLTQVEALYNSALLGSRQAKEGPEDTWGNVKIPFLEPTDSPITLGGWTDVTAGPRPPENYVSLVGIPVVGRPTDKDGMFYLETSHLTVQCDPFTKVNVDRSLRDAVPGQVWWDMSSTNNPWGSNGTGGKGSTFFLETDIPLNDGSEEFDSRFDSYNGFLNTSATHKAYPKRKITYASMLGRNSSHNTVLNVANCYLGQIHLETAVKCQKEKCSAVRSRRSLTDRRDEHTTPFDHVLIAQLALKAFPRTFGAAKGSSPTEQFIFNSTSFRLISPTESFTENAAWVDLALLDTNTFSKRLALLLNTYYQLTLAPNAFFGDLPATNLSLYGVDTLPVSDADAYLPGNMSVRNTTFQEWFVPFENKAYNNGLYFVGATTNATISRSYEVYACNFVWLSLLLAAASTILLTGVASLILKRKTLGPEMFGFVTSMTYENHFVKIPEGGSMLDAMERARLLKDVEVCVGDVRGDDGVGHIALAAGVPLRKLERGRLYC
jgi:hypothetical protein